MDIQNGQKALFVVLAGRQYPAAQIGRTIVQGSKAGVFTLGQIVWPGEGRYLLKHLASNGFEVMAAAEVSIDGSSCDLIAQNARREAVHCLHSGEAAVLAPRHQGARFIRVARIGEAYIELMSQRTPPNMFEPCKEHRWLLKPLNHQC